MSNDDPKPLSEGSTFEKDLENIINKYSVENQSNTPDFILSQYLFACLKAFNIGVRRRDNWYDNKQEPCMPDEQRTHKHW